MAHYSALRSMRQLEYSHPGGLSIRKRTKSIRPCTCQSFAVLLLSKQELMMTPVLRPELWFELCSVRASLLRPFDTNQCRVTATVIHCLLFFGHFRPFNFPLTDHRCKLTVSIISALRQIRRTSKAQHDPDEDVHSRIMSRYQPVPWWWYSILFGFTLGLSITVVQAYPTGLPVWALFIAIGIAGLMVLPVGLVQAMTNIQVGVNVIVSEVSSCIDSIRFS